MDVVKIEKLARSSQNLRLLYVEDDAFARESTLEILNMFFNNINISVDGEDGLNAFKDGSFDLVITDINMPKMSGLDMIAHIRDLGAKTPILVLSAHDDTEYYEETIKSGIDGYLLKPIDINQFVDLLDKTVNIINREKELKDYQLNLEEKIKEQTLIIKESLYRDSLSGLYNFLKLNEDIDSLVFKTLIVLDITQLSLMSKQYGCRFTENLLGEVAKTLSVNIDSDMKLYKLEADKFAILSKMDDKESIRTFCEQILAYFDMNIITINKIE
ncbi:MAG: response regulator, partial [Campylobacterota bacterium]|nr:response regulator [Campylobacterota bacterium]